MSNLAWMFIAFSAVWLAIGGYVISLGARQRRLDERLRGLVASSDPDSD